jgi:CheY-like chemotaxis protein
MSGLDSISKVLLVDDEADVGETLVAILELFDVEADYAQSGAEGIELFKANKYDLIVTDFAMGSMNGVDFAREIKKLPHGMETPIVLASGSVAYSDKVGEAEAELFAGLLEKPYDVDSFENLANKLFS